jgi:two-component system sensor histidine kinase/response regulator
MARILLAEDEPINAQMAAFICRRASHHVRVASDGLRALELLAREPFDLVLADVLMPRMDGITLTHAIRHDPALADLPVVGLTALAGSDDQAAMLRAGMNRVITKPCHAQAIETAIAEVLEACRAQAFEENFSES